MGLSEGSRLGAEGCCAVVPACAEIVGDEGEVTAWVGVRGRVVGEGGGGKGPG